MQKKTTTLTNVSGIFVIIFGVLTAIAPHTFLPVCQYTGKFVTTAAGKQISMKCFWTANAEIVVGIMIVVVAALLIVSRQTETKRALGIVGAILGVFVILIPTVLIGTCMTPTMSCNLLAKPGLLLFGVIVIILNAVITVKPQGESP